MRNLPVKALEPAWLEFKEWVPACYQAPSRAIARELRDGLVAEYQRELPDAVACFQNDFEAGITHLRSRSTGARSGPRIPWSDCFLEVRRPFKSSQPVP